jgi:hypothetical protein
VTWQRLESAAIDPGLAEGLAARVADPLWALARQWQVGEFQAEDSPGPTLAGADIGVAPLTAVQVGATEAGDLITGSNIDVPLEVLVERETVANQTNRAWLSAEAGYLLLRALGRAGVPQRVRRRLKQNYVVSVSASDTIDPAARLRLEILARGSLDGEAIYRAWSEGGGNATALAGLEQIRPRAAAAIAVVLEGWIATVDSRFQEPDEDQPAAWDDERLEYGLRLGAPHPSGSGDLVLKAAAHPGGSLDWYAFDVGDHGLGVEGQVQMRRPRVLPTPVSYPGMPAPRFWSFEDGSVHLGGIAAAPEDLARSIFAAFGTVYADDWFVIPSVLPTGSVAQVRALRVFDDFGGVHDIVSAAEFDGPDRVWRFFELSGDDKGATPLLVLPPAIDPTEAGPPLERVELIRDENANLVWAIEYRVEGVDGRPIDRNARIEVAEPPAPVQTGEPWRYVVTGSVPENWIPFVPVRLRNDGSIALRRGQIAVNDGDHRPAARGRILRPDVQRVFLHEEEVPEGGLTVTRRWQTARDVNGGLHLWVGRRKRLGRGRTGSQLRHDALER